MVEHKGCPKNNTHNKEDFYFVTNWRRGYYVDWGKIYRL